MVKAVFDNLKQEQPKNHFTVGITDDVSGTSLEVTESIDTSPRGVFRAKFYGLGSDGTVGANQNSIKIIGDNTDLYAQGYFVYDSKKSGGVTISHLRFGKEPIQSPYLIDQPDFVACHNPSYVTLYDLLEGIKEGGTFLLNSGWNEEEMEERLPAAMKRTIARKKLKFYNIDAFKIAGEVGLGNRINIVMQSAFFKLAQVIDPELAFEKIEESVEKTYGRKGPKIVEMNIAAMNGAIKELKEIHYPESWAEATRGAEHVPEPAPQHVRELVYPMMALKGDELPVSAFRPEGIFATSTTRYEKRGIGVQIPVWLAENCNQCNQCSFVCPHAALRPYLARPEDLENSPAGYQTLEATGKALKGWHYRMQVSPLDCTGCGNCVDICPARTTALEMKPLDEVLSLEEKNFRFAETLPEPRLDLPVSTIRGSQFRRPLFEYSGACAGCGETPYLKLVTQLFGERMLIANATGCSSIYSSNHPTSAYAVNSKGRGPAYASSLFEDNAEFGYGYYLSVLQQREKLVEYVQEALAQPGLSTGLAEALKDWLKVKEKGQASLEALIEFGQFYRRRLKQRPGPWGGLATS